MPFSATRFSAFSGVAFRRVKTRGISHAIEGIHLSRIILNCLVMERITKSAHRADNIFTGNMLRSHHIGAVTVRRILPATLVLGAILTHLASEFFGMGADADAGIVLSPRHAYLALVAIACFIFIFFEVRRLLARATGTLDLKRQLSNSVSQLPLGGDWRFYALGGALQFALGLGSAVGEGCFFCGHDAFFGVVGALFTAAMLAVFGKLLTARLPRLAAAIADILLPVVRFNSNVKRPDLTFTASARPFFWSLQLANRPPPLAS